MRTDDGIDLFSKPVEPAPLLAQGKTPRGLTDEGWVRTTGWLQIGDHPVSSASLAALAGLLWALVGAAVSVRAVPVTAGILVLVMPVLCGLLWWFFTTRVRPASVARNVETKHADELAVGDLVRVYGSIGPVTQVIGVVVEDEVDVTFQGELRQSWPRDRVVHVAELLN
ncbi:hypothetical protein [Lentzea sp. NPDC051838]|uniref:hypothetical protein n=1 Tax=Lentzea sp. NPDC051838 TaxID=3154849 RepID=UPI00341802A2